MSTNITKPPNRDLFRTSAERGLPEAARVDTAKRIVYGAKAMQVGPLSAGDHRPWKIDRVTLEQLQEFAAAKPAGVKMRFSHPNMSRDGMGRHVGRARNPRIVEDDGPAYLAVDCHLNAKGGPRTADQVAHILDLADSAPEDFGLSIAPLLDEAAMSKQEPDRDGLKAVRIKSLDAIDFVDEPAATNGLFALDTVDMQDLPAQATELLDTYFANASAEVIRARFSDFVSTYLTNREGAEMATKQDEKPAKPETLGVQEDVDALKTEVEALKADIAAMKAADATEGEGEGEGETPPQPPGDMDAKKSALADLTRRKEVSALCKLAKVPDEERDLLLSAGLSKSEAQSWIRDAGYLAKNNKPLEESDGNLDAKKPTPAETFGKEWDASADLFTAQGINRESYVKSRLKG